MKKMIIGLFFIILLISGLQTFADNTTKQIELPMTDQNVETSVGDVELTFCNKDNAAKHNYNLETSAKPGENKELCMDIKNRTKTDIVLDLSFVDGTFTNDKDPRKACKNKNDVESFGKFVKDGNEKILIKAESQITLKKNVVFDEQRIGLNNGCVVYSLADTKPVSAGGMSYKVIIRKAGFIDVKVDGEIKSDIHFITQGGGNNLTQSELIIKEYDTYIDIYTSITNDGNIPMIVSGSGELTDIIGKKLDIGTGTIKLLPKETRELHFSVDKEHRRYFNLLGMKPSVSRYRTFYFANLHLYYEPDTINSQIDKQLYSNSRTLDATAFLMPGRLLILMSLIMVYIIYRLIKKKREKKNNLRNLDIYNSNHNESQINTMGDSTPN